VAIHPLPQRVAVSFPTNDGLTITPVIFPRAQLPQILANPEAHLVAALRMVPSLAEPFSGASRVERIRIMGNIPNFFRKPHGDAWALVGDAGYHKDPILAQGISDALRSAEWLADAIHAGFSGAQPLGDALDMYARQRDAHFQPMYALGGGHTLCDMAVIRRRPDKGTDLTGAHLHGHADEADQGGHLCIPYLSPSFLRMCSSRCVRRRSHVRANDPGVGVSHPVSNKSQFGIEMGQPLQVLRSYVDDVRRCMRREGPAFQPNSSPAPYPVPIYVAALTSKALEQAAEITDGIMPVFWPVSRVKQSQVWITRGHAKAPERPKELIRCRPLSKPFICDDNCGKPARSAVTR
jgi:hypothetical protein